MNNQLTFKSHTFTPIIVNNLPYLGYPQIADALGYGKRVGQNDTPLRKLYERHADEFTPDMSFLTTIDTNGGKQQVRVFSLRGCHLLAMFSKTPVAKEFRRWVLDLIEQQNRAVPAAVDMKAIGGIYLPSFQLPTIFCVKNTIMCLIKTWQKHCNAGIGLVTTILGKLSIKVFSV